VLLGGKKYGFSLFIHDPYCYGCSKDIGLENLCESVLIECAKNALRKCIEISMKRRIILMGDGIGCHPILYAASNLFSIPKSLLRRFGDNIDKVICLSPFDNVSSYVSRKYGRLFKAFIEQFDSTCLARNLKYKLNVFCSINNECSKKLYNECKSNKKGILINISCEDDKILESTEVTSIISQIIIPSENFISKKIEKIENGGTSSFLLDRKLVGTLKDGWEEIFD